MILDPTDRRHVRAKGAARKATRTERYEAKGPRRPRPMREL